SSSFRPAPPPAELYTLSLHDALPILQGQLAVAFAQVSKGGWLAGNTGGAGAVDGAITINAAIGIQIVITVSSRRCRFAGIDKTRSEEHTSELQSRENLVCRLLLEKKK